MHQKKIPEKLNLIFSSIFLTKNTNFLGILPIFSKIEMFAFLELKIIFYNTLPYREIKVTYTC